MTMHDIPDRYRTRSLSSDELRASFLADGLFQPGAVTLRHVDLDRIVLGGAVPVDRPLVLEAPDWMAAAYFAERRELGLLNIGGAGTVTVDGVALPAERRDVVYVGRGSREVVLASADAARPARFYIVSYPAHVAHPTRRIAREEATVTELGTGEGANCRRLAKYIYPDAGPSAQLVMGVTELASGSVWNTMPSHTHTRRSEAYLYFDLPPNAVVVHLMGEPTETRHLIVRDGEVVLSPPWSIHSGCGTTNYAFCWAMGGENQDFGDMQPVDMNTLR
jgi:4-deoxy-L-threo-5-hexosulose-uronate ketol-isomerase